MRNHKNFTMLRHSFNVSISQRFIKMYCLKYYQKLPITLEKSWDYFSSPVNLKFLTPSYLDFCITNDLEGKLMYPGQIITYTIRPFLNIPIEWVTEITQVEKPYYFIDEMRFGPYKFWHHEHRFKEIENGIEMIDTIYYKLPFSYIGQLLNSLKVKSDIEKIFFYRKKVLEDLFGPYNKIN